MPYSPLAAASAWRAETCQRTTQLLERFDHEVEDDPEQRQHEHAGEHEPGIELAIGDQHQVAEPFVGAHELAHDGADHGERACNFQAAEDGRQRVGEADVPEHLEGVAAHGTHKIDGLGRAERSPIMVSITIGKE